MNISIQFLLSSLTACLEILLFGGVIFGFPSLQYVLEQEGYFEYLCNNSNNSTHEMLFRATNSNFILKPCDEQDANFNLAFTLASSLLFLVAFPWGYLLDRFGTWIFRSILSVCYTVGYVLLVVSTSNSAILLYPALSLFGIAGLGILMTNYQIANLAKTVRGSLITLMNGLFSSSVVVFLIVKKCYDFGVGLPLMMQILTCSTLLLWVRTYLLLPRKTIPFPLPSSKVNYGWNEINCCIHKHEKNEASSTFLSNKTKVAENEAVSLISFKQTLKDPLYWTDMYHFSVISLRLSFLISSLLSWLKSFNSEAAQVSKLTDDFASIVVFGVFISPLNGIIIDAIKKLLKTSTSHEQTLNLKAYFVSMLITSVLSVIYSILALVPSAYGTFIFFLLTRGFSHGGHTAFVAANFPFYHFGKLYGLAGTVFGLVAFIQYGLFQISIHFDPTFYFINVGFLIACIFTLVHPLAIFVRIRQFNRCKANRRHTVNAIMVKNAE